MTGNKVRPCLFRELPFGARQYDKADHNSSLSSRLKVFAIRLERFLPLQREMLYDIGERTHFETASIKSGTTEYF